MIVHYRSALTANFCHASENVVINVFDTLIHLKSAVHAVVTCKSNLKNIYYYLHDCYQMYFLANNHHVVLQRLQIHQYKVNLTLKKI